MQVYNNFCFLFQQKRVPDGAKSTIKGWMMRKRKYFLTDLQKNAALHNTSPRIVGLHHMNQVHFPFLIVMYKQLYGIMCEEDNILFALYHG